MRADVTGSRVDIDTVRSEVANLNGTAIVFHRDLK